MGQTGTAEVLGSKDLVQSANQTLRRELYVGFCFVSIHKPVWIQHEAEGDAVGERGSFAVAGRRLQGSSEFRYQGLTIGFSVYYILQGLNF